MVSEEQATIASFRKDALNEQGVFFIIKEAHNKQNVIQYKESIFNGLLREGTKNYGEI